MSDPFVSQGKSFIRTEEIAAVYTFEHSPGQFNTHIMLRSGKEFVWLGDHVEYIQKSVIDEAEKRKA